MARELVGADPCALEQALDWPLIDLLHALRYRLRTLAREQYHTEVQVWAAIAPHQEKPDKPPQIPEVLRG